MFDIQLDMLDNYFSASNFRLNLGSAIAQEVEIHGLQFLYGPANGICVENYHLLSSLKNFWDAKHVYLAKFQYSLINIAPK